MAGSIFGKRHFWEKREAIDAERFCQIWYDYSEDKSLIEGIELLSSMSINKYRTLYCVNIYKHIPPKCNLKYPIELYYDPLVRKVFVVTPKFGVIHLELKGIGEVEFNNADFHTLTPKDIQDKFEPNELNGRFELVNTVID